jgi:prepilin-type N-terminal cleavage/methylation domain-containing protein
MKPTPIPASRPDRTAGFTLIETTAVIAIVGAMAAAAWPRMTALAGDARHAALEQARASLSTVATMSHAKFLINGQAAQTFQDSTVALVHGYPAASQATAEAAGLGAGFMALAQPSSPGALMLVPRDLAGSARAADCFLVYEQASAARPVPRISLGANARPETCN